jgi:Tfp pilus assembly protein PilV
MRPRAGFTLVEVLVAVLFIDVAVLASVATSAFVVRRQVELRAHMAASDAAANRLESLALGPCAPATGSAAGPLGIVEHWSTTIIDGVRSIRDSIAFRTGTTAKHVVLETRKPC